MSYLAEILKRIQLFFLAFALAAGSMLLVGMGSEKLDQSVEYTGLADKVATYLSNSTMFKGAIFGGSQDASSGVGTPQKERKINAARPDTVD